MLINLDQSRRFNSVDHQFLEAVPMAASFGYYFWAWIQFLYATLSAQAGVNGFVLSCSICHGCLLLSLFCVLALKMLFCKLKVNPTQCGITLNGARYSIYADNVSVLVRSSAKIEQSWHRNQGQRSTVINPLACSWACVGAITLQVKI